MSRRKSNLSGRGSVLKYMYDIQIFDAWPHKHPGGTTHDRGGRYNRRVGPEAALATRTAVGGGTRDWVERWTRKVALELYHHRSSHDYMAVRTRHHAKCVSAPHGGLGHRQCDTRHATADARESTWCRMMEEGGQEGKEKPTTPAPATAAWGLSSW